MPSLYTPFLAEAGASISRGMQARGVKQHQAQQNKLAGSAYMGDPKAMQELMQLNPQLGAKIMEENRKRKESQQQKELEKQTRTRKIFTENQEIIDEVVSDVGKFDNLDEAKDYWDRKKEQYKPIFGDTLDGVELTDQMWQEARNLNKTKGGAPFNVNAPVTLVNPETKEKMLVSPVTNKQTGDAELSEFDIPEGFEISTETSEERRIADTLAANTRKIKSLEAEQKFKPRTAAQVQLAKNATARADKHFVQIDKIKTNILNLQEARRQVVAGAGTGPIEKLLPSFQSASIALDSAVGRLGLDVVQATTFGALSKGELDLSKDIALPSGLEGEDLIKWIDGRISAQENVSNYLERQAIFLSEVDENGDPNTVAKWVKKEKSIMEQILESEGVSDEDIQETIRENTNMNNRGDVLRELRKRYENGRP